MLEKLSPLVCILQHIHSCRNAEKDFLLGKVLTIIDSAIPNECQNKAIKDVVKNSWYEKSYHWDNMEEILRQFRDKFCKDIESNYQYKLDEVDPSIPRVAPPDYFV